MSATHVLSPESGTLLVKTTRAGMAAKVGHDLTIEAQAWRGQAVVDLTDPAASSVSVEVDVDSLVVVEGAGGIKPLSGSDKREIQRNIQRKILHTDQHPTLTFTSSAVSGTPDDFAVEGQLTIAGQTAPVTLRGAVADGRARGSASVVQSRWGIKPFTAFLGALKLDDEVTVEFDVDLS
jgi:polyisoprenoid-binding protein YceI